MQLILNSLETPFRDIAPFSSQLLKWVGNKQRFSHEIARHFSSFQRYFEPFLGSAAVLGTVSPRAGLGSDTFGPLIEIWQTLQQNPDQIKTWYRDRFDLVNRLGKVGAYESVRKSYNTNPSGADLLFLSRSCYGGVVRFRHADGVMSTPCGAHVPISPTAFARRVDEWYRRVRHCSFEKLDFREAMSRAGAGDFIYCDPPYLHSQSILYGAQSFNFGELLDVIEQCKRRGVRVALSIDGTKKSGTTICDVPVRSDLFAREILINCGRSMLKRFQMNGDSLEQEEVSDRLLLTY